MADRPPPNDTAVGEAIAEIMGRIPDMPIDQRVDFLEALVSLGIHLMRAGSGPDYVRGFLTGAMNDLDKPAWLTMTDRRQN